MIMRLAMRIWVLPAKMGWIGGLGLSLLLAACVGIASLYGPMRGEAQRLRDDIDRLSRFPHRSMVKTDRRMPAGWLQALPVAARNDNRLKQVHEIAAKHGLSLRQGDYRVLPSPAPGIGIVQMALKTEGDYLRLRVFLANLVAEVPGFAITSLQLSRQKIGDVRIETTIGAQLLHRIAP